ncbi:MAG: HAD hydrolase family protein [Candidatus Omnitrophica bacterium]|nr:HAD hydrolase family protein [Candidatus Omnitrophota bacterium]
MDIQERAKKIKLLLLDVDGVLTDGSVVIGSYGDEIKNFNIHDGLGIVLAAKAGLHVAIMTALKSKIVKFRANQLGIQKIYANHLKLKLLPSVKRDFGVKEEEICFVGDELIDLPILKRVGLAITVPVGIKEAKELAHYVTEKKGGYGAVREVCELILKAQGKWDGVTKKYFE